MGERSYTVAEIEALRRAVENKWLWGSYRPKFGAPTSMSDGGCYTVFAGMSRTYRERDKLEAVEQITRTHMLAGHTAADLYASESTDFAKATGETE